MSEGNKKVICDDVLEQQNTLNIICLLFEQDFVQKQNLKCEYSYQCILSFKVSLLDCVILLLYTVVYTQAAAVLLKN